MDAFLDQFFNPEVFRESLPTVIRGFGVNLSLMFVAEVCVLVWALAVALLRDLPGPVRRSRCGGWRSPTSTCSAACRRSW